MRVSAAFLKSVCGLFSAVEVIVRQQKCFFLTDTSDRQKHGGWWGEERVGLNWLGGMCVCLHTAYNYLAASMHGLNHS